MSNWEHVDKEEIIISEEGLDEAIHNAYLKGRNDVLDKIRAEIQKLRNCSCGNSDGIIDDVEDIIDKQKGARSEEREIKNIETVKNLIEELQKLPSDAYISFCDYDGDFEAEIRWDITQEEYEEGYEDQPYIYLTRPRTFRW